MKRAEPEPGAGKEDSRLRQSDLAVSGISLTTMATAQPLLFDREEEVIFLQEHATPSGKATAIAAFAAEQGWKMDLGPSTRRPAPATQEWERCGTQEL